MADGACALPVALGAAGGEYVKHGFATSGDGGGAQFDIEFHGAWHVRGGGVELVEDVEIGGHDADLIAQGVFRCPVMPLA
ncbi:hypothetical protein DK37_24385 [Halomonas sp. SUBG004]|nr:hypothetical protein DK37_24385 [Halomonas sp. SUBG004]